MLVKITNNAVDAFPYSIRQLKQDNPESSFPETLAGLDLSDYGVYIVTVSDKPPTDHDQKVVSNNEPTLLDGVWVLGWTVRGLTVDELAEEAAAARRDRDELLVESDWTQLADVYLSQAQQSKWTDYRLALRNITNQPKFPTLIDWPPAP